MLFNLLVIFFGATVGLYFLYKATEWVLENYPAVLFSKESEFHRMPEKVKKEYYSRIVSDLHAIVATCASIYVIYFACESPSDTVFTNFQCLNEPKLVGLYIIAISSAYCLYDMYICLFEI